MKPYKAHKAAIDAPGTPLRHTILYRLRATRGIYHQRARYLVKFTCLYASRHIEHSRQAFCLHVHPLYSSISISPFCSFYLYVDKELVCFPPGYINYSVHTCTRLPVAGLSMLRPQFYTQPAYSNIALRYRESIYDILVIQAVT